MIRTKKVRIYRQKGKAVNAGHMSKYTFVREIRRRTVVLVMYRLDVDEELGEKVYLIL